MHGTVPEPRAQSKELRGDVTSTQPVRRAESPARSAIFTLRRPAQSDANQAVPEWVAHGLLVRGFLMPIGAADVGVEDGVVFEIVRKVMANEFKRKQFPPTLRVSSKAWVGRAYPIAHRFRE